MFIGLSYIIMVCYFSVAVHEYTHVWQLQRYSDAHDIQINITAVCVLGNMPPSDKIQPYFENGSVMNGLLRLSGMEGGVGWIEYDSRYPIQYIYGMNRNELEAVIMQLAFICLMLAPWMVVL